MEYIRFKNVGKWKKRVHAIDWKVPFGQEEISRPSISQTRRTTPRMCAVWDGEELIDRYKQANQTLSSCVCLCVCMRVGVY